MNIVAYAWLVLAGLLPPPPVAHVEAFRPAFLAVASGLELMDEREQSYSLNNPLAYTTDLEWFRQRLSLLHQCPRLADATGLPSRDTITDWLVFNREYAAYLSRRHAIDSSIYQPELWIALQETHWLYSFWDTARDASSSMYYVSVRRLALADMRERLGAEAYARRDWPPPVPLWRFVRP